MLSAIIVAGGSSRRMGFDKTFALIAGNPVIAHAIAAFEAAPSVAEIIIVSRAEGMEEMRKLTSHLVIPGGVHRQDSVAHGLRELGASARYVAVHDAARPLVRPEHIEQVYAEAQRTGAAALAAPVRDTLKRADADRVVCESIPRENVYAMETPQIFERALLEEAYASVVKQQLQITDEVSAIEQLGRKVLLVPNERANFKITYPDDLALAEFVLSRGQ